MHFDVYGKADTLFRMYSMTKPITSTALLMLYEEGRFQLDDPLSRYLPEFKDVRVYVSGAGRQITTEELKRPISILDVFRHTAGFAGGNHPVAQLQSEAKIFEGGLAEKDSTLGIPARPKDLPRLATYYRFENGKLVVNDKPATSTYTGVRGGSSLTSTARDYMRFAQMIANGGELDGVRILAPGTVRLMRSDHLPADVWMGSPAGGTKYGLGVGVLVDPVARGNPGNKGEYGWSGAASTHYIADP